jgi:hypothetical protein
MRQFETPQRDSVGNQTHPVKADYKLEVDRLRLTQKKWWLKSDHLISPFISF